MAQIRFGTVINCMDGRVQLPMIAWMKDSFGVDYVDMITEPGPDKAVSQGPPEVVALIRRKVDISVEVHQSRHVVIMGHEDCAGNPVTKERHIEDIKAALAVIKGWNLPAAVYGVWVYLNGQVEIIDTINGR